MTTRNEGWWWPVECEKRHYFRDGRSLCGRWGSFNGDFPDCPDDALLNCAGCQKKRQREKAKAERGKR